MKKRKGFTLVELLITITVMTILATVAVISFVSFTNKADKREIDKTVEQINAYLDGERLSYKGDKKTYEYANYVMRKYQFIVDEKLNINSEDNTHVFIYNVEQNELMYVDYSDIYISDVYDVSDDLRVDYKVSVSDDGTILKSERAYFIKSNVHTVADSVIDSLREEAFNGAIVVKLDPNFVISEDDQDKDKYKANVKYYMYNSETYELEDVSDIDSIKNDISIVYAYADLYSKEIVNDSTITYDGMFEGWTSLKKVYIFEDVSYIGQECFKGCSGIELVKINGNNLKTIYEYAFSGCSSLTTINLPYGITDIQKYAFENTSSLDTIIYPASVKFVTDSCFINSGIIKFSASYGTDPKKDNLTQVSKYAFSNCARLKEVTLPDTVSVIGINAFYKTTSLSSFDVPDSVSSIPTSCFEDSAISKVIINENLENIGENAFNNCVNLQDISVYSKVKYIGEKAFYNTTSLKKFDTFTPIISILSTSVFENSAIEEINITNTVTTISPFAFQNCDKLKSISLNSVKDVGKNSFYGCESLISLTISNTVTKIDEYAFKGCSRLQFVNLQTGSVLKTINTGAFMDCPLIEEFTIPSSLTTLGSNAFEISDSCARREDGSAGLKTLTFNNVTLLTAISNSAFKGNAISSLIIPSCIINIEESAFENCTKLSSITFNNGLKAIKENAFKNAGSDSSSGLVISSYIDNVNNQNRFPLSLDTLGVSSFENSGITSLHLGGVNDTSHTYMNAIGEKAFKNCDKLTNAVLDYSIASIGNEAFYDCGALTFLSFTKTVRGFIESGSVGIGENTFNNTSLNYLTYYGSETELESMDAASRLHLKGIIIKSINKSKSDETVYLKYRETGATDGDYFAVITYN